MRTSPPLLCFLFPIAFLAALCLPPALLPAQEQLPYVVRGDQPPDNSPQPNYTTDHYTAVVVSSLDGRPVSRVLVTSPDRRFAAMTDYEGRISFDYRRIVQSNTDPRTPIPGLFGFGLYGGPQTMPIQFQVRKPGYVSNMVVLYLPAAPPDTPQPPLQLKIVPAGIITGHVDPDNGAAAPSFLQVQLYRKSIQNGIATWNTAAGAAVNSSGAFRFPDLQPGDYKLGTGAWNSPAPQRPGPDSLPGLKPSFYPDATTLDSAGLIHVAPAETVTARLVPHAATFYHVTIPIGADDAGGASVMLLSDSTGLNINFNTQDHALEGYLPTGSYTADVITFTRNPPAPPTQPGTPTLVRLVPNRTQNTTSTVAHFEVGSAPVHGAPVTPSPTSNIPIYVHREFTNPNPSSSSNVQVFSGPANVQNQRTPAVYVFLQPLASNRGSSANLAPVLPSDPDDTLKLQNVTEGVYHVNVQSTQGGYVASATCGTTDLLRDPLTVGASGSAFPIVVTLRDDAASVSGTILPGSAASTPTPTDGGPANPIIVMGIPLDRPETNPLASGVMINPSMPQGSFRIGMVPPGRYLFVASSRQIYQELEYRNPDILRDLMTEGTPVTLSAGQKTDIQVPLLPISSQSSEGN